MSTHPFIAFDAPTRSAIATRALLLAAIALLACGMSVGLHHPIQDNNEGLYARIALEVLEGHSWVIPTIDGVPYMEKPPLVYWLTAGDARVMRDGELPDRDRHDAHADVRHGLHGPVQLGGIRHVRGRLPGRRTRLDSSRLCCPGLGRALLIARRLDRMEASRWSLGIPAGWAMFFS
jgi:4-amino-4-deoxy-L-arabinose transferase-like glycosyltransferase